MRLSRTTAFAATLALACGPVGGGDSATSTTAGSGTTAATQATTTDTTDTSGDTTNTGGGGSGGATTGAPDPTTTTAPPPTTDATTAPATTGMTTGMTTDGGTTGGAPASCGVLAPDHGDCDLALGVGFDGVECVARSGCDCAPDCDKFFPDMASCALACADAGHCNADRLHGAGLAKDPIEPGDLCDEIDVCPSDAAIADVFEQIFGMLTCEGNGKPCPGQICTGLWQNMLGPDEWRKVCAASLVQGSGDLFCFVFGP